MNKVMLLEDLGRSSQARELVNRLDGSLPKHESGNSQLLIEYRKALIKAFDLGEDIKEVYGVVPPKVLHVAQGVHNTIGLIVS